MKRIPAFLAVRRESITLALMLEFLHGAIWFDFGSLSSRSLMLIHFGLFLIWQPVWRSDEKLAWYNGTAFIFLTLAFVTWMNWWLLYGWLILLVGFCGGLTTFSAFSLEGVVLLHVGQLLTTFAYVLVSLIGWLAAAWLGHAAAVRLIR